MQLTVTSAVGSTCAGNGCTLADVAPGTIDLEATETERGVTADFTLTVQ